MSKLHYISDGDLTQYHVDAIRGPELVRIEEHFLWCSYCIGREVKHLRKIREKGRAHMGHISTDELELYHLGLITDAIALAEIETTSHNVRTAATACWRPNGFSRYCGLV
jgi:hypothetical protein